MDEIEIVKSENEKLKKITESRSDLISVTAHKLRTSLSALKWTLEMLLSKDLGEVNNEQRDYIKKAIDSNERSINIVNYLLTFNRTDDISMAINFSKVNVADIIEKVISIFSGEIKNKDINLIFTKPDIVIPEINCDEEMIMDVFQNLIENAIKYSSNGTSVTITLDYKTDANEIKISVHDNGIGIKKEDQMKIFNKFFRAPNAIEKDATGSGLGLFTVKNIVEKHNGKIWFESSSTTGTTFFVVLPIL